MHWRMNKWKKWMKYIVMAVVGVILMLMGGWINILPKDPVTEEPIRTNEVITHQEYGEYMEDKIEGFISGINGIGNVEVVVYTDSGVTSEGAVNRETTHTETGGDSLQDMEKYEYVIVKDSKGEEQIVILNERYPPILGIAIYAQGAEKAVVREKIISAITAAFDIPVHRISVIY